jgi:hypothetical protein
MVYKDFEEGGCGLFMVRYWYSLEKIEEYYEGSYSE